MRHAVKVVLCLAALALVATLALRTLSIAPGDWLKPAVLVAGGPVLIIVAPFALVASVRFRGRATGTEGIVEKCEEASLSEPGYELTIRFTALDGGEHLFTGETTRRRPVGHPVRVLYDPRCPEDARIDGPIAVDAIGSVLMFAMGVAFTYLLWRDHLQG
ncbi:DUF3592 domain-containing protein [Actinomadura sp. 9N407]|uniref:DUF3592 domain-containing protein n=1 Tax=Actinomadura sp. 9N407 TaxID=3375154 RepID=UPI0037900992